MPASLFPLPRLIALTGAGLLGALALGPYAHAVSDLRPTGHRASLRQILIASVIQNGIFVLIAAGIGLWLAAALGWDTALYGGIAGGIGPEPRLLDILLRAVVAGALTGGLMLVLDLILFRRHLPAALRDIDRDIAAWKALLASVYGGVNEEIAVRLFGFTLLIWLIRLIFPAAESLALPVQFWIANLGTALLFGLIHLPSAASLAPLTRIIVLRTLLLNGLAGMVFGFLFWHSGLVSAMLAHFSANLVVHVIPLLCDPIPARS